jgi:uncharacterized FlaG/YvyC family protein
MSTDFSIKPVGAPVATPVAHSASEAATHAVATELPTAQSVTAADASVRARNDFETANANVSRQIVLDRAAASIVYQVVDERTSLVVQQFPDEAVLRRRAYFRTLDLTRAEPGHRLVTDRKA